MNYGLIRFATYIFGCGLAMFSLLSIYVIGVHASELVLPRSYWYKYNSITPSKSIYSIGDEIYGVSDTTRRNPIKTQRQDTMSCDNGFREKKYPTQYRPKTGTEIPQLGTSVDSRPYEYKPDLQEKKCVLCGTVVSTTEHGYDKNYQYCTIWFGVNGHSIPKSTNI